MSLVYVLRQENMLKMQNRMRLERGSSDLLLRIILEKIRTYYIRNAMQCKAMNFEDNKTVLVMIDLSAAFDTIHLKIIINLTHWNDQNMSAEKKFIKLCNLSQSNGL